MSSRLDRLLVIALALVLVLTVVSILVSTRSTAERVTIQQMEQVMTRVAFEASDEAGAFLDPAASMARLSADLLDDGVFDESDPAEFEEFLIDVLRENRLWAGLFVGRPDGDFFYVKRDDEVIANGFRTKVITVDDGAREVALTWRDEVGTVVRRGTDPDDAYDPRQRPWYEAAVAAGDSVWTDPYVFFSSRQPGITVSAPLSGRVGVDEGVFGVDVEIRQLSEILANLPISEEGAAFIVDASGQLVGISEAVELGLEDGNSLRRLRPTEVGDPTLREAAAALADIGGPVVDEAAFVPFEADGREWRAGFEPFATGRWPWTIAVYAPEDDFLGEVRETQAANTRLAVVVGALALLTVLAITTGLTRPLARMRVSVETDQLTGLANRRALDRRGPGLVANAAHDAVPLAAVVMDIDHFKAVNDSYGHNLGDEVLTAVAGRLRRSVDEADLLVRQGGEEFLVVLPGTDQDGAEAVARRLVAAIRGAPINTSEGPIPVTISAGAAAGVPRDGTSIRDLVGSADKALYEAKREGRDRHVVHAL